MMVEVARLRKPLAIAALPRRKAPWSVLEQAAGRRFRGGKGLWGGLRRILNGKGLAPFARDIGAFHSMMFERGLAVPLGKPFLPRPGGAPDDLALVAARIRALLGQPGGKE